MSEPFENNADKAISYSRAEDIIRNDKLELVFQALFGDTYEYDVKDLAETLASKDKKYKEYYIQNKYYRNKKENN